MINLEKINRKDVFKDILSRHVLCINPLINKNKSDQFSSFILCVRECINSSLNASKGITFCCKIRLERLYRAKKLNGWQRKHGETFGSTKVKPFCAFI